MIDCENEVYTRVAQALRSQFSKIDISGDYTLTPSAFPHVSFYEADNAVDTMHTSDTTETDYVTFTVEVYSNKVPGKKTEAKQIMNAIDTVMFGLNAERLSKLVVPNRENTSIYRLVARYRVLTDGTFFYRR